MIKIKIIFFLVFSLNFNLFASEMCVNSVCPLEKNSSNPMNVMNEISELINTEMKSNSSLSPECSALMSKLSGFSSVMNSGNQVQVANNLLKTLEGFPGLIEKSCFTNPQKAIGLGLSFFDGIGQSIISAGSNSALGSLAIGAEATGLALSGISRLGLVIMDWIGKQKERTDIDPLKEVLSAKNQEDLMHSLCQYRKLAYMYDQNTLDGGEQEQVRANIRKIEGETGKLNVLVGPQGCLNLGSQLNEIESMGADIAGILNFKQEDGNARKYAKACSDIVDGDTKSNWMKTTADLLCQRLKCVVNSSNSVCSLLDSFVSLDIIVMDGDSCHLNSLWKSKMACFNLKPENKGKVSTFVETMQMFSDAIPSALNAVKTDSSFEEYLKLSEQKRMLEMKAEQLKNQLAWQDSTHRNSTEVSLRGLSRFLLNNEKSGFLNYIKDKDSEILSLKENSKSKIVNMLSSVENNKKDSTQAKSQIIDDIKYLWMNYQPARDHEKRIKLICETFLNPCKFKNKSNRFITWLDSDKEVAVDGQTMEISKFQSACADHDYQETKKKSLCEFFKDSCSSGGRNSKDPSDYKGVWFLINQYTRENKDSFEPDFLSELGKAFPCRF